MKMLSFLTVCIAFLVAGSFFSIPIAGAASIDGNVEISTYSDWQSEIGSGGHLSALTSWDSSLESLYPGESSSFHAASLSAMSDLYGKSALAIDFGTINAEENFIGGISYAYNSSVNLTSKIFEWSILKIVDSTLTRLSGIDLKTESIINLTYQLTLKDSQGKPCFWLLEIPSRSVATDSPWAQITLDPSKIRYSTWTPGLAWKRWLAGNLPIKANSIRRRK